jgi:hypothetical protein
MKADCDEATDPIPGFGVSGLLRLMLAPESFLQYTSRRIRELGSILSEIADKSANASSNPATPLPGDTVLWLWQDSGKNARKNLRQRAGLCGRKGFPQCS